MSNGVCRMALNEDKGTVSSFGREWARFDQATLSRSELREMFDQYFSVFPWHLLPPGAVGADIGCGSGRWAAIASERVGHLHCVDASAEALSVSRRTLAEKANTSFHLASVGELPFADSSLDFCYSLGVLHHVPDTAAAIKSCAAVLKPGAPLLVYLYYALDGRPWWYRMLWRVSDGVRYVVSALPDLAKRWVTDGIAALVYWPLARLATLLERIGLDVTNFPLAHYRGHSFYTLRTDSRDRFGTPLEQRFSLRQIKEMMAAAGLENMEHSPRPPFWCVVGRRRSHV